MNSKVIINPKNISPRKGEDPCEICTMNVAPVTYHAWDLMGKEKLSDHPVCSLCMLYESPWGQKRSVEIAELVQEIEANSGSSFMRKDDGKLALASEANIVLGAIAFSSNVLFAMQDGSIDPVQVHEMMTPSTDIRPEDLLKDRPLIDLPFPTSARGETPPAETPVLSALSEATETPKPLWTNPPTPHEPSSEPVTTPAGIIVPPELGGKRYKASPFTTMNPPSPPVEGPETKPEGEK